MASPRILGAKTVNPSLTFLSLESCLLLTPQGAGLGRVATLLKGMILFNHQKIWQPVFRCTIFRGTQSKQKQER